MCQQKTYTLPKCCAKAPTNYHLIHSGVYTWGWCLGIVLMYNLTGNSERTHERPNTQHKASTAVHSTHPGAPSRTPVQKTGKTEDQQNDSRNLSNSAPQDDLHNCWRDKNNTTETLKKEHKEETTCANSSPT